MKSFVWGSGIASLAVISAVACSAANGSSSRTDSTASSGGETYVGGAGSGAGGSGAGGSGESTSSGGTVSFGGTNSAGTSPGPDGGCAQVVQQAEKRTGGRADIIFVLDNSGSMTEETLAVQNNMNNFSSLIANAGIDAHVVIISSGPKCTNIFDLNCWLSGNGICLAPPLGLDGACPDGDDTNLAAGYMHWRQEVGSHDALAQIQNTFSNWQSMLRADAAKTFVVVTDDESNPPPTADEFTAWVNSQPVFQGAVWRFSGVFCVTTSANCAGQGLTYSQLVTQTGGIVGDMAQFSSGNVDSAFATVFDTLADAVVQDAVPVDCEWAIPPPSGDQEINFTQANVQYTNSTTGTTSDIYGVHNATECTDQYGGWYYDDPAHPSRVITCPSTCNVLQSDLGATVSVIFGCEETVYAPIK